MMTIIIEDVKIHTTETNTTDVTGTGITSLITTAVDQVLMIGK